MPGYKPLCDSPTDRSLAGRCWVSPSMLPLLYLAPMQETVSCFSFSQFIWASWLSLGGAFLPSSLSIYMTSGPFQFCSCWTLIRGHIRKVCFFGLKAGMAGKALSPLLSPSLCSGGMVLSGWLTSFGLKPLILTRFEAAGWQPVLVVGVVPRAEAVRQASGQMRCACPWLLGPIPILKPGVAYLFIGFAEAEVAGAAQSRQEGRGGGQHYDQCCVEPALLGHLLEVSSPVDWHEPEDYE